MFGLVAWLNREEDVAMSKGSKAGLKCDDTRVNGPTLKSGEMGRS